MNFFWYCCLATPEKFALTQLAIYFLINAGEPMPFYEWAGLWAGAGAGGAERAANAHVAWSLTDTFIIIPDEPPVPAVGFGDPIAWAEVGAFIMSPDALCLDGCPQPFWA